MQYRVIADEDYFDIAAASIPMYWPKATWLQAVYSKPRAVIIALCVTSFCLLTFLWWFIAPLLVLGLYMLWPVLADRRYMPYRDQRQADIYYALPKSVRKQLRFALRRQWRDMHNAQINQKLDAIFAQYAQVYAIEEANDNSTDDFMDRLQHEYIIASELVRIRRETL